MSNLKLKPRTIIVLFTLAAMTVASAYFFLNQVSAFGLSGKIFTTTFDGQFVPQNHYSSKDAVYLNGGPVNAGADGLPDGTYYFQVTGPSGNDLLSTDAAVCRQLVVANGVIAAAEGPSCLHSTGIPDLSTGATPIKLMPFSDTTNPGGNYTAWLIAKTSNTTVAADGIHINFRNSDAKSEIFRADSVPCTNCSPTSVLAGRKYYDANANGLFDPGEVPVADVQILIIAGSTSTIVSTSASGIWSTAVPTGAEYLVIEYLPFTGPAGQPGSYWQQTAPAPDSEGLQSYRGTANTDQINLNIGNICFNPDLNGNPIASSSPCPVSDLPPPEPTPMPTPTPTPCPDCPTTAVLSGTKFYDANANGTGDDGDVPIAGVQIAVVLTTDQGTFVRFATTDASGNWSLTVPIGAQYLISEYLPDTDPAVEPGGYSYWEQTAPLPNDEGFRGYSGTATEDRSGLSFGNDCFHTDADGNNPLRSPTPCTVRYPATPTPTPTPTPDQ
ncbi:MAG: hypothetical protein ABIP75_05885 [Pyrinomonadaceae bacterium]